MIPWEFRSVFYHCHLMLSQNEHVFTLKYDDILKIKMAYSLEKLNYVVELNHWKKNSKVLLQMFIRFIISEYVILGTGE